MPDQFYALFIGCVWIAWITYWWLASSGTKTTQRAESFLSRQSHLVLLISGGVLIGMGDIPQWPWFSLRLWPPGPFTYWTGVGLLLLGLAYTVWARRHLATNWSSTVTLKEDHELIRSGPYRWVRHPIYTGLFIAFLGTAISRGELRGIIGVVLIFAGLVRKLRIEERWMREKFGIEYERYVAQVPALLPFIF